MDDQPLVRNGIASLIEARGHTVVGEAQDGAEALAYCEAFEPDLVLMDLRMPGMNGLEATREILARRPETKIVMLTISDLAQELFEN